MSHQGPVGNSFYGAFGLNNPPLLPISLDPK